MVDGHRLGVELIRRLCRWFRAATTPPGPQPVRPRVAGRGADPATGRDLGGQLSRLRSPQAVEGRASGGHRDRPRPDREADAHRGDRGREALEASENYAPGCCVGAAPRSGQAGFTAMAPNRLRVTDLTLVPAWVGVACVCLLVEAFSRMILGWRVASHVRTDIVLDAIEMSRWSPWCSPRRSGLSQRRRVLVQVDPPRRTPRGDRRNALDRNHRRQL